MAFDKELIEILVCPQCKGDLALNEKEDGLLCQNCRLKYNIQDGIPIMLIHEAEPFE